MKSLVARPQELEKIMSPETSELRCSGKHLAHYELISKVTNLEGSVVKCGIATEDDLDYFIGMKKFLRSSNNKKVIIFEKQNRSLYVGDRKNLTGSFEYKNETTPLNKSLIEQQMLTRGFSNNLQFIPGCLEDSLPDYLIENPDLKISFLNIDLDDYEATYTTLEFFYPRLMHGGILIFDNYYKKEEEYKAVNAYFNTSNVGINNFSVNKGPHYLVRQ